MGEAKKRGTFEERIRTAPDFKFPNQVTDAKFNKVKRGVWVSIPWPLRVVALAAIWFVFGYGLPK